MAARIWKVTVLAGLLVLALGSAALADHHEIIFEDDQCEEVVIDGEVVLLCEDDGGTLYVCVAAEGVNDDNGDDENNNNGVNDDNGDDENNNNGIGGELDDVLLDCVVVEEFPEDDDLDGVAPVRGVDTGAGGTAPILPTSAATMGLGLLALTAAVVGRLRRAAS